MPNRDTIFVPRAVTVGPTNPSGITFADAGAIIPRNGTFAFHRGRLHESSCRCDGSADAIPITDPRTATNPDSDPAT
jgi:hypothetical protein